MLDKPVDPELLGLLGADAGRIQRDERLKQSPSRQRRSSPDSFVVIELKQWSYATRYEDSDSLVDVEHAAGPRLHPGIQVGDYCQYLTDFLGLLAEHGHTVRGAAYLHNAVDRDITELLERPATEQSRIFTKQ